MTIQRKINISIIIFIAISALFLFFAVFPLAQDIKKNSEELFSQRKLAVDNEAQKKNIEQFKVFSSLFDANFTKIGNLFVDLDVPVEFIQFLENNALESNLYIIISSLAKDAPGKNEWPVLSLQVFVSGSFADFLRFFEKIENSYYLVEIQNLNVSASGPEGNVNADFAIKVFSKI